MEGRDFTDLTDLAAQRLGGAVLTANDEFFASKENLLKGGEAVWKEGEYTDVGKWMDGWETRRRREPGHDWCVVRLGLPGTLRGVIVDTAHFRGNYPESCSLEACAVEGYPTPEELAAAPWIEVLPRSPLEGNAKNRFPIERETGRFNIYPDGGVARLRVHGEVAPDWRRLTRHGGEVDLAASGNGGLVLSCSDMFFGNRHNLILPGPPLGMHDGWETRRRRGPGHDWAIVKLGARGTIHRVEVDTSHFKGNAPGSCSIEGCDETRDWKEILPLTPLRPHTLHRFDEIAAAGPVTHARLNIFPDGGVARLRLFGTVAMLDRLSAMSAGEVEAELLACCGSRAWARRMAEGRPFQSAADLKQKSDQIWRSLGRENWLEAFAAHPRIGEKGGFKSQQEQAGALGAAVKTLAELAAANREYESRFDHIFIVCATGKSAEEMLGLLRARLDNDPETELRVAAEEQRKITNLRLEKLLA
jgi:allantoicase